MKAWEVRELLGITKQTLWRWTRTKDKEGNPITPRIRYVKVSRNNYIYNDDDVYSLMGGRKKTNELVVVYGRVSFPSEKEELDAQVQRCVDYANKTGLTVDKIHAEVGKGTETDPAHRKGLYNLMKDVFKKKVDLVIVESPDRLSTFSNDWFRNMFRYFKTRIIFLNEAAANPRYKNEVMKDMIGMVSELKKRYEGRGAAEAAQAGVGTYDSGGDKRKDTAVKDGLFRNNEIK